jgi:DNA ligase (NAD+)
MSLSDDHTSNEGKSSDDDPVLRGAKLRGRGHVSNSGGSNEGSKGESNEGSSEELPVRAVAKSGSDSESPGPADRHLSMGTGKAIDVTDIAEFVRTRKADGPSRIEGRLKATTDPKEIGKWLDICDFLYFSDKPYTYDGVTYTFDDLPSDDVYDRYRRDYTPDVRAGDHLVGTDIPDDEKVPHEYPMETLEKVRADDVRKLGRFTMEPSVVITPKYDGASFRATFENGKLMMGVTRHDKVNGRLITNKLSNIIQRPDMETLWKYCNSMIDGGIDRADTIRLVVRGELILTGRSFADLGYKNRRNGVSGIMGRKDGKNIKYVSPIVFEINELSVIQGKKSKDSGKKDLGKKDSEDKVSCVPTTEIDRLKLLKVLGFTIPRYKVVEGKVLNADYLGKLYREWSEEEAKNFDMDGLVLAPNRVSFDKIAFKLQLDGTETRIVKIVFRATRTGKIYPRIIFEPIIINGSLINKANGNSFSDILNRDMRIGSKIFVVLSGGVIPLILSIDNNIEGESPEKFRVPKACPSCKKAIEFDGEHLVCKNVACPAKLEGIVAHFFDIMGLKGIGDDLIGKLDVDTIEDAYDLSLEEIQEKDGFGKKRAGIFYEGIRKILIDAPEERLLASVGIPGLSDKKAKLICEAMTLGELFRCSAFGRTEGLSKDKSKAGATADDEIYEAPAEILTRLKGVKGLGPVMIKNIKAHYNRVCTLISFLTTKGLKTIRTGGKSSSKLSGQTFVLTDMGKQTREEYTELIRKHGGKVAVTVTKKLVDTGFLVANKGTKNMKTSAAKEYGVRVIDYDKLEKILKEAEEDQ